jgi:ABC-2 type transport system ATP-binding protein
MHDIVLNNVWKFFRRKSEIGHANTKAGLLEVLRDVSLEVAEGKILCLLGRNGTGKTTLIRIISTLIQPDSGEVKVCGYDVKKNAGQVRRNLGVMLNAGEGGFQLRLSAMTNLEYYAALYQIPIRQARTRVKSLLYELGLAGREWDQCQSYSSGMRRRLALMRALLSDAPVLLLDEPTLGVDPWSTGEIHRKLRELAKDGKTILCTTNSVSEAQALGGRMLLLNNGTITESNQLEADVV